MLHRQGVRVPGQNYTPPAANSFRPDPIHMPKHVIGAVVGHGVVVLRPVPEGIRALGTTPALTERGQHEPDALQAIDVVHPIVPCLGERSIGSPAKITHALDHDAGAVDGGLGQNGKLGQPVPVASGMYRPQRPDKNQDTESAQDGKRSRSETRSSYPRVLPLVLPPIHILPSRATCSMRCSATRFAASMVGMPSRSDTANTSWSVPATLSICRRTLSTL